MSSSTADPTAEDAQPPGGRAPSEPSAGPESPVDPEPLTAPEGAADLEQLAEGGDPPYAQAGPAPEDASADLPAGPPDDPGLPGTDAAPADHGPEDHAPADYAPADYAPADYAPADYGPEDYGPEDDASADYGPEDAVPDQKPPFSKIAIAAMVTGIVPLVPVGIGLGVTGLVTTRRGRRRGRELAVTGLLAAITWLGIGAAVATVGVLTHGFHRVTTVKYNYRQAAVFSLREGECVQDPSSSTPALVSCSSPHGAEVFATFALTGGSWPGTAAVQQDAQEGCSSRLAGYLNQQLAISLSQDYVYPSQVDWQAGTRTIVCEVSAATGQLTQSVRGAS